MKPYAIFRLVFCIAVLGLQVSASLTYGQDSTANSMKAHFINVGQADATLLEFPCGAILIDAGAQDSTAQTTLVRYLQHFFARRTDLHNTLDLVVISHDHVDHDITLPRVAQTFTIKHYVDNGHTNANDSGEPMQANMEQYAQQHGIPYENFSFEQITAGGNHQGLTDSVIEPLHCAVISPQITVLSGRFASKPAGWYSSDYSNENNHSLVIRVQFGKASFLFSGDLETAGNNQLVTWYGNNALLDVDVWKVSHHAAVNGTSATLLAAITPQYAVIHCGQWNYGMGPPVQTFSTYAYGHPRITTLDALQQSIPGNRPQAITVKAASAQYTFSDYTVTKNIYATAWDGNVTIQATSSGTYTVVTNDQ